MFLIIPISTVKAAEINESELIVYDGLDFTYQTTISNEVLYRSDPFLATNLSALHITNWNNIAFYESVYFNAPKIDVSDTYSFTTIIDNIDIINNGWTDVSEYTNKWFRIEISFVINSGSSENQAKIYAESQLSKLNIYGLTNGQFVSPLVLQDIYQQGYERGRESANQEVNDFWDQRYDDGYDSGYADGQDDQYDIDYAEWYMPRYQKGLADSENGSIALTEFIPGILGTVFAFFFQLASIQFLGISILEILTALFGIAIAIFVIKIFIK